MAEEKTVTTIRFPVLEYNDPQLGDNVWNRDFTQQLILIGVDKDKVVFDSYLLRKSGWVCLAQACCLMKARFMEELHPQFSIVERIAYIKEEKKGKEIKRKK